MSDILVVDDFASRQALCKLLSDSPYNYLSVSEASNAQRSLMLLKQEQPDIVIFDLSMPDIDGLDFGQKIMDTSPSIQIIVLSHLQMFEIAYQAINAGFAGYLVKPIIKTELFLVLERIIEKNLLRDAAEQIQSQNRLTRSSSKSSIDFGNPIESVLTYISEHYNEPISLQDVAESVYLSPSYFSRLFKTEVGMTFTEYLTKFRIDKSKTILRITSLPVEVIANNTGFSNLSYFSTTFKRIEGRTPTEYRNLFTELQSD